MEKQNIISWTFFVFLNKNEGQNSCIMKKQNDSVVLFITWGEKIG